MFIAGILFSSTLFEEISETIGKKSVRKRRETVYNLAFLSLFWTLTLLIVAGLIGVKFVVQEASWPFLIVRMIIGIALNFVAAQAVVQADRSTLGFIRLLTIPLVLATDIMLGYHLTTLQIVAVCVMFVGLVAAFHHNPTGKRGAGWALLVAILAAADATLYKHDITHYNSVVGEQVVVYSAVVLFFYVCSVRQGSRPLHLLARPITGIQSFTDGCGLAIESFAFSFAPASVVVAAKRTFALMWSIVFGHRYFHEHKLHRKLFAGAVLAVGLILLVSPGI